MKKITLILFLVSISFLSFTHADSQLDQSIFWMNSNGLTKFTNATDFMANKNLRRDEASKFFVQYATEILKQTPNAINISCSFFTDLNKARPGLKDLIKQSCQLGLFQGSNSKFMPTQSLTNGQAITVLVRMLEGKMDETQGHFAQKYFERAGELGILSGINISPLNFDKLTTRGDVGKLLFNASSLSGYAKTSEEIAKESCNKFPIGDEYFDCLYIQNNSISEGMSEDAFDIVNANLRKLYEEGKPYYYYSIEISDSYLGREYCEAHTVSSQTCVWIRDGKVASRTTIFY